MASVPARGIRDVNHVPSLIAVSNVDNLTPVALTANPTTGALEVEANITVDTITLSENIAQWGGASTSLGQKASASSVPVVIASDQSSIAVTASNPSVGTDGSAIPTSSTLIGASDGTNLQQLLVESSTNRNLRIAIYNGSTEVSVTGSNALKVDGSAVTQPISASSLPLPTGAATAAKQPALGTAGVASADVITIQGIASMTSVKVDGSGVTQPVSGTITANIGTTNGLALDATLTGGTQRTKITDGTNNAAVKAASTAAVATDPALVVAVSPNNSVAVTGTFWQATQPVSGTVTANIGTTNGLALDTSVNGLLLAQASTTSGQKGPLMQGAVTTSAPTYTTAQTNPLSLTTAGALRVDNSGVTQPISGTITANAGTNLNTSALALESGGNLATIAGSVVAQATALGTTKNLLIAGSVTTSAPTYTTGNINPLSLTTAGALRVDNSGVTQPVSGTVTANIGTSGSLALDATLTGGTQRTKVTDGTNNAAVKAASTAAVATDPALVVAISPNNTVAVTESGTWNVGASTATGSAVPANAFYNGGLAKTALPTAATDGNLTGLMTDKFGRLVVLTSSIRDLQGNQATTISNSTAETTIVTAGATGVFNDLASINIVNTSASATRVDIRDATAGSVIMTFYVPGGDMRGAVFSTPWSQTTAANNWTATCGTAVTDVRISVQYLKNK